MSVFEYNFEQYKSLSPDLYRKEKYNLQVELLKLQEDVIKKKRKIAICFEGRDTAGKSSTINFFSEHLIPSNFKYVHLGIPTKKERKNWFERYEIFLPNQLANDFWDKIWEAGKYLGIRAIGFNALNIARVETGFIVANSDFITAEHAIRNNRTRNPDEIGLSWMVDMSKPFFNGKDAIVKIRKNKLSKYVFAALEIDGKEPADGAIIYHDKKYEVGIITAATWSPTAKKSIALASMKLPYGQKIKSNLWVEIYVLRELEYYKMMKKVSRVKTPFVKLKRRTLTPPLKN